VRVSRSEKLNSAGTPANICLQILLLHDCPAGITESGLKEPLSPFTQAIDALIAPLPKHSTQPCLDCGERHAIGQRSLKYDFKILLSA
jgi:hypothetical protein